MNDAAAHDWCIGTPLGFERMLGRSLFEHYELNWEQYPAIAAELGQVVAEEVLSVSRHFLEERGLLKADDDDRPCGLRAGLRVERQC